MKTIKTITYSLTLVAGSTLLITSAFANQDSPWECQPSKDFRTWICLKDGQSPVEPDIADTEVKTVEPATSQPVESGVVVTPLTEPQAIEPQPIETTPVAPTVADEPPEPESEPLSEPVMAEPEAPVEPPPATAIETQPQLAVEPEAPATSEPVTEVTDTPASEPILEPVPEPEPEAVAVEEPREETVAPVIETQEQETIKPDTQTELTDVEEGPAEQQVIEPIAEPAETEQPPIASDNSAASETMEQEQVSAPVKSLTASETDDFSVAHINYALPSCVAINNPSALSADERAHQRETAATQIEADNATIIKDKTTSLTGNVIITRADQHLRADEVVLDKAEDTATATGAVVYTDSELQLKADQGRLDLDADENTFEKVTFTTLDRYARGKSDQIATRKGTEVTLDNVSYTSCPPGKDTWMLSADKIVLDDVSGRGTATNAKVEFFDIPIFYAPYLTFPIDDRRQTGLLTPRISNSDDRGFEITAPIYWNIAPDRDATFYPRYMTERGLQLGGEFRYLNKNNYGQVNLDYLGDDNEFNDEERWAFNYEHNGDYFNGWDFETRIRRVSDKQYFEDLGSSPTLSSQRYLQSYLKIKKNIPNWSFYGLVQDYQVVDRTLRSSPYERKPHLRVNWYDTFASRFQARVNTQYTDFDSDTSRVTGKRTDIYPSLTYNYETPGYYIRPKFGVRYTRYSLSNEGTLPSSPSRSLPVFSIDSKLFYERETSLLGKSMLQTLEPRIYYLKIPEKSQSNIPIFDTGLADYNYNTLFRENRFNGTDRIGDTNQLSVGVTTRFLESDTGQERLSLTVGQIYYFSDREVTLPGGVEDDDDSSPIITELSYRPYDDLVASALLYWDPEENHTDRSAFRFKYQPADDRIVNVAYRFRDNVSRQTDVSFLWPITDDNRWHAIGRWNYSHKYDKSLDILGGIEYESCCWKTRVVARRWLNDINGDQDTGIFFELELKGLGSIGDDVSSFLETGILGYDRHIRDDDDDTYYY